MAESYSVEAYLKANTTSFNKGFNDAITGLKNFKKNVSKIDTAPIRQAGDSLQDAGNKMKSVGSGFTAGVTAPLAGGLALVTKGTEQYRQELARLETNAQTAGIGTQTLKDELVKLSGISDETDSNVEALSNILATGFDKTGLTKTMEALSGAVVKFPDTLKIEGLADGLQETVATGKAIGPFAEMLERMGVDLDTFNQGLAEASKKGQTQNYILDTLAKTGLAEVSKKYRENNKNLVESKEASADFRNATAELGNTLAPIMTKITEMITKVLDTFNNLKPAVQKVIIVFAGIAAVFGPVITFAGVFAASVGALVTRIAPLIARTTVLRKVLLGVMRVFAVLSNPITALVAIITTILIPVFIKLYQENQKFREIVMMVWNQIKMVITTVVQTVVAFVMQIWGSLTAFWDEHGQMILQAAMNVWNVIKTVITTVMNVIWAIMQTLWPVIKSLIVSTWNAIKGVIQGAIDVILGIIQFFSALFTGNWSEMWEAVKRIVSGAVKLVWNLVQLWFVGKILKLGKTLFKSLTGIVKNLWSKVSSFFTSGVTKAKNIVSTGFNFIKSKITSIMNSVKSFISSVWNGIKSIISNITNSIKTTVSRIWGRIYDAIREKMSKAKDKVSEILEKIKGFFDKLDLYKSGKAIIQSAIDGIVAMKDKILGKVEDIVDAVRDFWPFSPAKRGPLSDIDKMDFAGPIGKSVDKAKKPLTNATKSLAKSVGKNLPTIGFSADFSSMNKRIQPSNIGSRVDRVNRMSHNAMRYDYTNELTVSKQPAYINVAIGGQEFNAFVGDITDQQKRSAYYNKKVRR
ncbi:hypothetical protein CAI16_05440 [Virgibacillus dokdonensis]|uniref:Phage-related minor tail protein n=1 Tax=Virgibacillus dokdonensis TaxID=302167 RepID=A0A3E0WTB9_9BACI|nr:hypothetical protein [Virgibacillus dokdonensis]RFA36232.1 hypothetical protein CAI16_05440 [Virgibacillus dokdonensis]